MLSVNIECDCDELSNCDVKAGDNSFKIADIKKCAYCGCYFARIDFPQTFDRQLNSRRLK